MLMLECIFVENSKRAKKKEHKPKHSRNVSCRVSCRIRLVGKD